MAKARKREMAGTASESSVGTMTDERTTAAADTRGDTTSAPQMAGDTTAAAPDRDRVAMRAYELYLARGGADGAALDDWLAAERELNPPGPDDRMDE